MSITPLGLFEGDGPRVRNVPASAPFLDLLAERLVAELSASDDPFALSDTIILLPNRRARLSLIEAFSKRADVTLLPTIRPLGDLDDDPDVWGPDPAAFDAPPKIDELRRRLELAQFLRAKARAEDSADDPLLAIAAADELCKLLDAAASAENVDWSRLPDLVADKDLAQHWARSAVFLEIIAKNWPLLLAAEGMMDPGERRTKLLNALAEQWTIDPPQTPIVIAGSTGSVRAVRRLMGVVSHLPRGVVVLPGLDTEIDDAAWQKITEQHPQFGLRETLSDLKLDRGAIPTLRGAEETPQAAARRVLVSEALASADVTADWISRVQIAAKPWGDGASFMRAATAQFTLHAARTEDEEATIAALALREAVETPGLTAALVTPDSNLARRVSAKLKRWNIEIAPSAGVPLAETAPGMLIDLLAALTADDGDPVALAALIKHPLTIFAAMDGAQSFERDFLRGARRRPNLAAFIAATRGKPSADLVDAIEAALAPLTEIIAAGDYGLDTYAGALAKAAEKACGEIPWAGRAGEGAVKFLETLGEFGGSLGAITRSQAPRLIRAMMQGKMVAPDSDDDPRIAIWGPLEARMQRRDVIVLGGLNEGKWPAPPPEDPFLSRALRRDLGLPPADARVGLAAHDFAQLANAPRVVLTRAQRVDGQPTVASRWLWRLDALVQAAGGKLAAGGDLNAWAQMLDHPSAIAPAPPPRPKPADRHRITYLSVTDVEKLVRDPYAIYARRILGLRALSAIGLRPGAAERGTAVHDALEKFQQLTELEPTALLDLLNHELIDAGFSPERRAAYLARVEAAAGNFTEWATARSASRFAPQFEIEGRLQVGAALLVGRADRIDVRPDGRAEIIDYKTGAPPSDSMVASGFSPQLLLEAAMLEDGAFKDVGRARADALIYWRFGATGSGARAVKAEGDVDAAGREALAALKTLLTKYEGVNQPFLSRPRMKFVDDPGDYDHLARRQEWADLGGGE